MIRKNDSSSTALSKRARVEDEDDGSAHLTVAIGSTSSGGKPEAGALMRTVKRTSGLEAPIVALSGAHGVRWIMARLNGPCREKLIAPWLVRSEGRDHCVSLLARWQHDRSCISRQDYLYVCLDSCRDGRMGEGLSSRASSAEVATEITSTRLARPSLSSY